MIPGDKIILRALEDHDLELLRGWRNNPELARYACSSTPLSQIEQRTWYEGYAKNPKYRILIVEDEAKDPIGYAIIKNIDHLHRNAEIGMYLDPKSQGKGYGKDAFLTLMRHCVHDLNMHRLYLQVFDFNKRAIEMYEKLGFKTEGVLRDAFFKDNQYCDIVQMSILNTEFQE